MAEYSNENRGALFRNREKKSDNHPDYSGELDVAGVKHYVSAWLKESKAGTKFLSLSIKPKDAAALTSKPAAKQIDPTDDIPF